MTLEQIIEGCRKGDEHARANLYELYGSSFYGVVRRYVKDMSTAEDLFHDGFVTLFTHIEDYRGEGSFEGWCKRIFINTALNYFRKKNPLGDAMQFDELPSSRVSESEAIAELSAQEIKQCVDSLADGYKTIFNLYAVDGYSHREIADMLSISEATARTQYRRARVKLMDVLNRYLEYDH